MNRKLHGTRDVTFSIVAKGAGEIALIRMFPTFLCTDFVNDWIQPCCNDPPTPAPVKTQFGVV
jgi:hypothetical protein